MNRLPQPTFEELTIWRELAERARDACDRPRADSPALRRAHKRAKNRRVPDPPPTRVHPFVRLTRLTERFLAETGAGRVALAPELREVATLCLDRLEGDE